MKTDFELDQKVEVSISGEVGFVVGIAAYIEGGTQYSVH